MIKIMLVRHGVTAWNGTGKIQGHSNTELAPDGIHQARLLSVYCPFHEVDAIYSSDLLRAEATAKILANKFRLKVQTMPELRETNFGDWEGKVLREIAESDPQNFEKFFKQPDRLKIANAETFLDTQRRAMIALKKIIAAHQEQENPQVIVVAHGAINRVILCSVLEIPIRRMWSISQFNTGVNILREDDGHFTVELVNSTAHLGQEIKLRDQF